MKEPLGSPGGVAVIAEPLRALDTVRGVELLKDPQVSGRVDGRALGKCVKQILASQNGVMMWVAQILASLICLLRKF